MQASHRPPLCIATITLSLCALTSCGSSHAPTGSGSADPGAGSGTPLPVVRALGIRALPGYTITVSSRGSAGASQSFTFLAHIIPDVGVAAPVSVQGAVSVDKPGTWTMGTVVSGSASTWSWTAALPDKLADVRVWLRLTDAEENVVQSGFSDFPVE